jgi:hypothetical protein
MVPGAVVVIPIKTHSNGHAPRPGAGCMTHQDENGVPPVKDDRRIGLCNFCGGPAEEVTSHEGGRYVRLCCECTDRLLPRALAGAVKNCSWQNPILFGEFEDALARFAAEYWKSASMLIDHLHSRKWPQDEPDLGYFSADGDDDPDGP